MTHALSAPVGVELDHRTPYVVCYQLSPRGAFDVTSSSLLTEDSDTAWFTVVPPTEPDDPTATFTAEQARQTAAFLLGYLNRRRQQPPEQVPVTQLVVQPAEPTSRTRQATKWDLGSGGMMLRFHAQPPFQLVLDVPAPAAARPLTTRLAEDMALALLAGAQEIDHAHAVAAQAVHADRAGESVTNSVRAWLDSVREDLPRRNHGVDALIERLHTVLADEGSRVDAERFAITLGCAHGDLRQQLDTARLFARDSISHHEVAYLLFELARRHAIPMTSLTASSLPVLEQLPEGTQLTERQWTRVARSREMRSLNSQADGLIRDELLVDVHTALREAGVLCRGDHGECGTVLDGEVAQTWGFCPACRPTDLATAVKAGCVGFVPHDLPTSDGACRTCLIPLPPDYHNTTSRASAS